MAILGIKRLSDGGAAPARRASTPQAAPRALPRLRDLQRQQPQRERSTPKPLPRLEQGRQLLQPLPSERLFQQRPQQVSQERDDPGALFRPGVLANRSPVEQQASPERDDPGVPFRPGVLANRSPVGYRQRQAWARRAQTKADSVAEYYNMQARIGQRDIARREREAVDREETLEELSSDEWARLSPAQQAAVQANYDLSQAVARDYDRSVKHSASPEQIENYQNRVRRLFGENATTNFRGLAYAPNTVAFLDSRDLSAIDLAGKTLDDFLSGDALVTMYDIEKISDEVPKYSKEESAVRVRGATRNQNLSFAQQLSKGQLAYQARLAATLDQGDKLLADLTSRGTIDRAAASYGADPNQPRVALDKLRPDVMTNFDQYLEMLARTDMPTNETLQVIETDLRELGATNDEAAQIWEGMIERTRQATTGEGDWFSGIDWPMRPPLEVAEILGAPMLTRGSTTTAEE